MTTSRSRSRASSPVEPAYYARPRLLGRRVLGDWWSLLHPPYTLWHLSYVVIGACLVAPVNATILIATLLAFFLAVGVGAHALDELRGRPLGTQISRRTLITASVLSIAAAAAIGVAGLFVVGPALSIFIVVGVILVTGYNLELFGGRMHNDAVFALGWGSFPVLTAYFAQHGNLSAASVGLAACAFLLSRAQRELSTPARQIRRRTRDVEGTVVLNDGTTREITSETMIRPLEGALRSLSWAVLALALTMVIARFG